MRGASSAKPRVSDRLIGGGGTAGAMAGSPPRARVLLLRAAAADSRRSVSWFTSGGYWPTGTDGLNFSSWLAAHGPGSAAPAITGTQPCCGCWPGSARRRRARSRR